MSRNESSDAPIESTSPAFSFTDWYSRDACPLPSTYARMRSARSSSVRTGGVWYPMTRYARLMSPLIRRNLKLPCGGSGGEPSAAPA